MFTRYQRVRFINSFLALLIGATMFFCYMRGILSAPAAIGIGFGALMVMVIIMPSTRAAALRMIEQAECPLCGPDGDLREYPGEDARWFCRQCLAGWTERGRRWREEHASDEE